MVSKKISTNNKIKFNAYIFYSAMCSACEQTFPEFEHPLDAKLKTSLEAAREQYQLKPLVGDNNNNN